MASAGENLEGWYTWETTYVGTEAPTAGTITWPQYLVGKGHANDLKLECGVWYQTDRYEGKDKDIQKVIEDGVLSYDGKPEDHKIVKEWDFVYGGDCAKDPYVETGAWVDGQWECGDTSVTVSRTVTTTTYTWDRATAKFTSSSSEATETGTRPLTGDEAFPCPTEYVPACTAVEDSHVIYGDGVITVAGGWASESIAVPAVPATLAGIGSVLDIDATPLQFVGLHIDTPNGTIVFEEEPTYTGNLWSTSSWDGVNPGMGYGSLRFHRGVHPPQR